MSLLRRKRREPKPPSEEEVEPHHLRHRVASSFRNKPLVWSIIVQALGFIITLGGAGGVIVVLADLRYETKEQSSANLTAAVTAAIADTTKLRSEFESTKKDFEGFKGTVLGNQKDAKRELAWLSVGQARQSVDATSNRVTDCEIKEEKKEKMSALERQACRDFRDRLASANRRLTEESQRAGSLSH